MLRVRNWSKFQHYRDRSPPWLKLHRGLADDIAFHELSDKAGKYLAIVWIVVSDTDGVLPAIKTLAFRLRLAPEQVEAIIKELFDAGYLETAPADDKAAAEPAKEPARQPERGASATLAPRKREERRGETEGEGEESTTERTRRVARSAQRLTAARGEANLSIEISPTDRERFWKLGEASPVTEEELAFAVGRAAARRPRPKKPGAFVCQVIEDQRAEAAQLPDAPKRTETPNGRAYGYHNGTSSVPREVGDVAL